VGTDANDHGRFFRPRPLTVAKRLAGRKGLPLAQLNNLLEELYQPCCDHPAHNLADESMDSLLENMIREVYALQGTDGGINEAVATYISNALWQGVVKGYGADITTVEYDSQDYQMLKAIKDNVWQFGAAQNYTHLRELSDALLAPDGTLRTFDEFRQLAIGINDKYFKRYLETEYNLAVNGGQMAAKWLRIIEQKDTFPMLQFDAVLDTQTTEICRPLDGVTLPVNHPFWNRFYPPNHFNCRSTVRQLPMGKATESIPPVDIPKMFQTNLGKQGLIFPPSHPYFVGLPDELKNRTAP
jgi:SPP1 gp7 family putative phage head morphogenesis protein